MENIARQLSPSPWIRILDCVLYLGRRVPVLLLAFAFLQLTTSPAESISPQIHPPQISIAATSGKTITFRTQNGDAINGHPSESRQIPHLVLLQNGQLTHSDERSLVVTVKDLQVPAGGVSVHLSVSTQHANMGQDQGFQDHILVWQETRQLPTSTPANGNLHKLIFYKLFEELTTINNQQSLTPTDYYQVDLRVESTDSADTEPLYVYEQDFAFLLENQWRVEPQIQGSAPSELVLYYYDMLPIPTTGGGFQSVESREDTTQYIQFELIPAMLSIFETMSTEWGISWHPEWRSYRQGESPGRLSISLTDGATWYHGRAYPRGSAGISLAVNSPENEDYQKLTDSLMSAFSHELFHNLQRSLNLHLGGDGDIDGLGNAWGFFSEGTAVLATSIAQPEIQFSRSSGIADYFRQANGFLAGGGDMERDLNRSYEEIDPYHAVLYWRYLYEQCSGFSRGIKDPQPGLQVISNALSVLYGQEIVDIRSSKDLVTYLPGIMDAAIREKGTCPFKDFQDSLLGFTRAIYLLNLENGRCFQPATPNGCGFYDPAKKYLFLPIPELTYTGQLLTLDNRDQKKPTAINSSFGMQFLEINLAHETWDFPIAIELSTQADQAAEFALQIAAINKRRNKVILFQEASRDLDANVARLAAQSNHGEITITRSQIGSFNQLGLMITRIDTQENNNLAGEYTITVYQK